jgi:hypothetical protein
MDYDITIIYFYQKLKRDELVADWRFLGVNRGISSTIFSFFARHHCATGQIEQLGLDFLQIKCTEFHHRLIKITWPTILCIHQMISQTV